MKFEFFVAQRLRLKNSTPGGGTSPSITIAIVGIALAIVIMMIAIVVILGFKHQIRDKLMGFDSQVSILPSSTTNELTPQNFIAFNDTLRQLTANVAPYAEASLSLKQPGLIKTDDNFMGVVFKGMDSNHSWKFIKENLIAGDIPNYRLDESANKIIISNMMANSLQLTIGDKIYAYFFNDGNVRTRRFEIAAIYESHFGEYDKLMSFASLSTLQKLNGISSESGTAIELRGLSPEEIIDTHITLQDSIIEACYNKRLKQIFQVDNIYHTGVFYFNWLDLLDTNVIVILILISLVAGFTLVSCMFIIILERVNTIGILKALGATNAQVRGIFISLTERLVLRGMIIGNIIAITLIMLQDTYKIIPLDPDAYYLSYVPVELNWWHVLLLNIGVVIVSTLILVFPSHLVSTISPAKTIRFE